MEEPNIIFGITYQEVAAIVVGGMGLLLVLPIYFRLLRRIVENRETIYGIAEDVGYVIRKVSEGLSVGSVSLGFKKSEKRTVSELQVEIDNLTDSLGKSEHIRSLLMEDGLRNSDGSLRDDWREPLVISRTRLSSETARLRNRSTVNLVMGVAFSSFAVIAMIVLFFIVDIRPEQMTLPSILSTFLPRLTIVVLLQLTASFFLKMHASNEADIKQNKNEITNIELKLTAVMLSVKASAEASVIEVLVREERNFILGKDQKVAGSSETVEIANLVNTFEKLLEKVGGK